MKPLSESQRVCLDKLFGDYKEKQDVTTGVIAEQMDLSTSTVQKYFARRFGNEYRMLMNSKKRRMNDEEIRRIFEEYKHHSNNVSSLAKKYGINEGTIRQSFNRVFKDEYAKISPQKMTGRGKRRLTNKEIEEIFKEYKDNPKINQRQLAVKYLVDVRTIWRLLKVHFGDDFRKISSKKCGWQRKLTDEEIKGIFLEYKNGITAVELSKRYSITREGLIARMRRVIGDEFVDVAHTRKLEDSGRKRQKVSNDDIRKLFEVYKNSSISVDELAGSAGLSESSLIARFNRLFGVEYKSIAFSRRDERKITAEECRNAFDEYRKTNISITELSDRIGTSTSSLASRFRKIFGVEYLEMAKRKMDIVDVNRKGSVAEDIAIAYLRYSEMHIEDVRRNCTLKNSLKKPDFIVGNTFVEVKSNYVTMDGFGRLKGYNNIVKDYMGKKLRTRDAKLTQGIIISMSGFSKEARAKACRDKIILVGPDELRAKFRERNDNESLSLLETFKTK